MNQPIDYDRVLERIVAERSASRPTARIIIPCWGEQYRDQLLAITLPALASPNNLPAFSEEFACELVLLTQAKFFDAIADHPATTRIRAFASVRLRSIDDLISQWYGITLTYALVRGFADLAGAMVGAHLLFFNADFILADGCLLQLAGAIRAGERLVCAPSYCVVHETFTAALETYFDAEHGSLTVPRRRMAELIIAHRHNTIRAKTVNQQLFRLHRQDQFYWYLDARTMLGRQLPIAIVYMRPERVVTEMTTFWDYGAKSTFCPSTTPTVLGDSDDFVMAELRAEATFADLLRLGSAAPAEIAADWSSFVVQDHLDFARCKLLLHAGDAPAQVDAADAELSRQVDAICAALPAPISNQNHPFWIGAIALFQATRAENLAWAGADLSMRRRPETSVSQAIKLYRRLFGQLPHTTRWHPYHSSFHRARDAFMRAAADARRVLFVAAPGALGLSLAESTDAAVVTITPLMATTGWPANAHRVGAPFDLCFCDLAFGELWQFAVMAERLRAVMSASGMIILFHHNIELRAIDSWAFIFAKDCLPRFGSSSLRMTGSWPAALASRCFHAVLPRLTLSTWRGRLTLAAVLAVCGPLARLGSWIEARRDAHGTAPVKCTSFVVELELS